MKKTIKKSLASGKVFEVAGVSYGPRRKTFKYSRFEFNPATLVATSYEWWTICKPMNGVVVFNDGRYSNTTSGHQSRLRAMLNTMGIKYITVDVGNDNLRDMTIADILAKLYFTLHLALLRESRSRTRGYGSKYIQDSIKNLIALDKDISMKQKKSIIENAKHLDEFQLKQKREASAASREKQKLKQSLLKTISQPSNELASEV